MKTLSTLFTGGGGFDTGAHQAGLKPLWGVEIDPDIADYAELNNPGLTVIRQGVETVDYTSLERPYWLHSSPVCKNASVAKQSGECKEDLDMAYGVVDAIDTLRPVVFSLENVWGYRHFEAFRKIVRWLGRFGYAVDWWHLNAANYGVPQTRKRLILLARRDSGLLTRPPATHGKPPEQLTLFETVRPWVGWYEAIEDLLPGLPDSEFAPWQLDRLPEELKTFLIMTGNTNRNGNDNQPGRRVCFVDEPANTVTAGLSGGMPKAFLLGQGQRSLPKPYHLPSNTVTGNTNQTGVKAFLMRPDNPNQVESQQVRFENSPAMTVASSWGGSTPRAFIVDCQKNGTPDENGERGLTIKGRVVSMTPRALARFQSVPDDYILPDKRALACQIIGNMVPPLLAQRIVQSQQ